MNLRRSTDEPEREVSGLNEGAFSDDGFDEDGGACSPSADFCSPSCSEERPRWSWALVLLPGEEFSLALFLFCFSLGIMLEPLLELWRPSLGFVSWSDDTC